MLRSAHTHFNHAVQAVDYSLWRAQVAIGLGLATLFIKDVPGARNVIPEPYDFFDHAGNVSPSIQVGSITSFMVYQFMRHETNIHKVRAAVMAGALCVGAAINTISETKTGQRLIDIPFIANSTPDPIDIVYGTVAAPLAAGVAVVARKEPTQAVNTELRQ